MFWVSCRALECQLISIDAWIKSPALSEGDPSHEQTYDTPKYRPCIFEVYTYVYYCKSLHAIFLREDLLQCRPQF